MRVELRRAGLAVPPEFAPRDSRARHFHDRVVVARTLDDGLVLHVRWDVSAGIDNLMSISKECSVFVETLNSK
jgi:hypothetical protein